MLASDVCGGCCFVHAVDAYLSVICLLELKFALLPRHQFLLIKTVDYLKLWEVALTEVTELIKILGLGA